MLFGPNKASEALITKVALSSSHDVHSDVSSVGYASSPAYSPELNRLLDELYMPTEIQPWEQSKPSTNTVQSQSLWSSAGPAYFTTSYRQEAQRRFPGPKSSVADGMFGEKQKILNPLPYEANSGRQFPRPATYFYSTPLNLLSDQNSSSRNTKGLSATLGLSRPAEEVLILVWVFVMSTVVSR